MWYSLALKGGGAHRRCAREHENIEIEIEAEPRATLESLVGYVARIEHERLDTDRIGWLLRAVHQQSYWRLPRGRRQGPRVRFRNRMAPRPARKRRLILAGRIRPLAALRSECQNRQLDRSNIIIERA